MVKEYGSSDFEHIRRSITLILRNSIEFHILRHSSHLERLTKYSNERT